ncbi:hypothetical protein J437_LFUL012815 [Ladona fulva]|uniref:Uncharacterized protein n=1 Tax=Ladona fulva TaxID=123851 RepID=A0A8K0KF63_LADFU|nr:hypothetical protein J437_LFUL012815 [Ladona fulva]
MEDFNFDVSKVDWGDYLKCYILYLLEHSLGNEVPGIQSALQFTKGVSKFRVVLRSTQLWTVILSFISIYVMGNCARKFYFEYLPLKGGNT